MKVLPKFFNPVLKRTSEIMMNGDYSRLFPSYLIPNLRWRSSRTNHQETINEI